MAWCFIELPVFAAVTDMTAGLRKSKAQIQTGKRCESSKATGQGVVNHCDTPVPIPNMQTTVCNLKTKSWQGNRVGVAMHGMHGMDCRASPSARLSRACAGFSNMLRTPSLRLAGVPVTTWGMDPRVWAGNGTKEQTRPSFVAPKLGEPLTQAGEPTAGGLPCVAALLGRATTRQKSQLSAWSLSICCRWLACPYRRRVSISIFMASNREEARFGMFWVLIASCCAVLGSDNPAFLSLITPVIIRVFQIDCEKLSPLKLCGSATCCLLLLNRLTLAWSLSNLAQLRAVPPVDVAHAVGYTTESSALILRVSTPSSVCRLFRRRKWGDHALSGSLTVTKKGDHGATPTLAALPRSGTEVTSVPFRLT
jgi:hypothetical protein